MKTFEPEDWRREGLMMPHGEIANGAKSRCGRASSLAVGLVLNLNLAWAGASLRADPVRKPGLQFERDIWPIVAANCVGCHGAEAPKAGLDLRTVARMLRGG